MPAIKFDTTLMRLIKDMQEVRAALRHVTTNLPLYDVANENTPASISTSQNNYVPGNYDVLRINATADVSITGIANGKKGRFLEIINVGTGKITLPHESASSIAVNRFTVVGGEDIIMFPTARIRIYYDVTLERWQVSERPAWMGTYGVAVRGFLSSFSVADSGAAGDVKITGFTITTDDWGLYDVANSKIVVPETGIYMGVLSGWFDANATGWRRLGVQTAGAFFVGQNMNAVTTGGVGSEISVPFFWTFSQGQDITFYATQNSGGALVLNRIGMAVMRVL